MKKQTALGILICVLLIGVTACKDQELRNATRTRFNEVWAYQTVLQAQIIDLRAAVAANAQLPDEQEQGPPGTDPKDPPDSLPSNWP
jgi:hypothetical protein